VTTDRADYAETLRRFEIDGISTDARQRQSQSEAPVALRNGAAGFQLPVTDSHRPWAVAA